MALFGNDMFGHHMVGNAHGKSQGFGKSSSSAFGSGQNSFGHSQSHGGNDAHNMGQLGNHAIFGRQKSLLNDMTHSKNDKSKPFVFSSYSYPYDFHHEGMASMFEKPLEKAKKKPVLTKQQSYSAGDKPELRRAPTFSSNPKLMRSKTINPSETQTTSRPPRISRSLSIADGQSAPANMDLAIPDFQRRHSERERRHSERERKHSSTEPSPKPKRTSWHDIVKRMSRKKKSGKDRGNKSATGSTDDSAKESVGSISSSIGTTDSRRSSTDFHHEDIPRSDTLDSKLSKGSWKSRSSVNSDYDKEQEKIILSLLNDLPTDDNVFSDRVSSTQSDPAVLSQGSPTKDHIDAPFDPLQVVDDEDIEPSEEERQFSESPTLVLRRIKHLNPPDADDGSVKSGTSGRMTPRSYFSDNSDLTTQTQSTERVPETVSSNKTVTAGPYPIPNGSIKSMDRNIVEPQEPESPESSPKRTSVHDLVKNFTSLKTQPPTKEVQEPMADDYKPKMLHKPYVEPKAFTVSPPPARPYTSIYSKPISPGYNQKAQPENQVIIQHVKPYTPNPSLEQLSPKYSTALKATEPEVKDAGGNDNLTANSSESGYSTSHVPNSPKSYDNMKVLNFVNSLPNHSDMDEHSSETTSHGELLMNGSGTDSDEENESEIFEPQSDLSNVKCESGSDTDVASIKSDISDSQLEVTKLLESPTEVCERVTSELSRHSNRSSPSIATMKKDNSSIKRPKPDVNNVPKKEHQSQRYPSDSKFRLERDNSETELMRLIHEEKFPSSQNKDPVEADIEVVLNKPLSTAPVTESKLYKTADHSENFSSVSKSKGPLLSYSSSRQYSTVQESSFTQCIDAVLHMLNCLLVLCSAGVIATGIWLLLKDFNVNHVTIILGDNLLQIIVYVSIAGAGIAILAALCLCCGIKKDKYGLSFFAIVLIIVIIAFSSAAILSAIFADKLHGVEFRVNFKERLIRKYGNMTDTNRENEYFTSSWDAMQQLFECCGAEGQASDMSSWAVFKKFSIWYRLQPLKATIYVPESCCKKNMNMEVCQGSDHTLLGPPVYGPPPDEIYSQENPNLNTTGCYDFFASYLAKLTSWVAIVMGGLAGLYFLTVMLTWVFCFKKNQDYEDYLYGSFYEMGHDHEDYGSGDHIETKVIDEVSPTMENYYTKTTGANYQNGPDYRSDNKMDYNVHHTLYENERHSRTCDIRGEAMKEALNDLRNVETVKETKYKSSFGTEPIQSHPNNNNYESRRTDGHLTMQDIRQESDDSISDTDSEVSLRRNLWLSSEPSCRARNLLSIAIEEEDSNFEDSDNENTAVLVQNK